MMLLARRARAQWGLLAALLAVVTIGATVLGVCVLLVTQSSERALEVAASRASPADVEVTAYTGTVAGRDARSVAADSRQILASSLAPFSATTTGRAVSEMRLLPEAAGAPDATAVAYLAGMEDLASHADLTAGRWPRAAADGSWEAVVLESTARQLGLAPGSRVRLGTQLARDPAPAADVVVVGIVHAPSGSGWDRDPLGGAGFDLAYGEGDSLKPARAFGPFLVDFTELIAGQVAIRQLEVTARPELSQAHRRDLDTVADAVQGADGRLGRTLGARVAVERVASGLPATLSSAWRQQQVTDATVLALAVLAAVLTAVALALAGRLTADVRTSESVLLSAMGVSRGQFALTAAVEAGALTALATALAVPGSTLLHAALGHLPPLAGAGLSTPPTTTGAQVFTVTAATLALAVLLVVLALRGAPATTGRSRRDVLARSGADLVFGALAVGGWWQLRAGAGDPIFHVDAVRVLAPALVLIGGVVLALRLMRLALAVGDRLARRGRGLVLPLAVFEAARRPQATAAALLVCLGCAAATFGLAAQATWQHSQRDQATMSVGTDLVVTLNRPPVAGQGAAVSAATGGAVSPAADQGVAIGQWLGAGGDVPWLVAVDTSRAGDLLRGRLDRGRTWTDVAAPLWPRTRPDGITVAPGAAITLTGQAGDATAVTAAATLVLQDADGLRTTCAAGSVPLDGRAHQLAGCDLAEGVRIVAVSLKVTPEPVGSDNDRTIQVAATLAVPGTAAGSWTATARTSVPEQVATATAALTASGSTAQLQATVTMQLGWGPDDTVELVLTGFTDPGRVPVAVSAGLADAVGARRGSLLDLTIGGTSVPIIVAEVVPSVPSAASGSAVLADLDALSRALIVRGHLTFPMDAWWVGQPDHADAAARAADLHLGSVTTSAAETTRRTAGPASAGLPAALLLLVRATVLLLLGGIILHVTSEPQARTAAPAARLRALGMSRRQIRASLVGQHVLVLVPLSVAGTAVGALATRIIAPLLIRSDTGAVPVPAVTPVWPWATEALLSGGLVIGCIIAVGVAVRLHVRGSDAARLRDAP